MPAFQRMYKIIMYAYCAHAYSIVNPYTMLYYLVICLFYIPLRIVPTY